MPLYEVEVREVWEFAYVREVQVNAKDEDEAEELAREEAHSQGGNWDERVGDMINIEYDVKELEKV